MPAEKLIWKRRPDDNRLVPVQIYPWSEIPAAVRHRNRGGHTKFPVQHYLKQAVVHFYLLFFLKLS